MISIVERPSQPMELIGSDPSVRGVGSEASFVRSQIQEIRAHWGEAITLSNSTEFRWVQSALNLFPGISGLTEIEAARYEESVNTLFMTSGKKTGRNFLK